MRKSERAVEEQIGELCASMREAAADTSAQGISTVEKASVILAVISTALIDEESENLRKQNELIRQQIREEEKSDKDKIQEWRDTVEDNEREIERNTKTYKGRG